MPDEHKSSEDGEHVLHEADVESSQRQARKSDSLTVKDPVNSKGCTVPMRPSFRRSRVSSSSMLVIEEYEEVDQEAITQQEREALTDLFSALDGESWKQSTNWCSDLPLDEWYGIKVVSDRVEEIKLVNNRMRGRIPKSISKLGKLKQVRMSENFICGEIPEALGECIALEGIWFNDNELSGELPSSIADLNQLRQLNLSENGITGTFPSCWKRLVALESIVMWGNRLSGGIPWQAVDQAPVLRYLDLRNNSLQDRDKERIVEVFGEQIPSHNLSL
jgi:hypothetical protein